MQQYNIDGPRHNEHLWETHVLGIEGMRSDECVKTLRKAIKRINGVKDVEVDREGARASVTFDTTKTDMAAVHDAILQSGYQPSEHAVAE